MFLECSCVSFKVKTYLVAISQYVDSMSGQVHELFCYVGGSEEFWEDSITSGQSSGSQGDCPTVVKCWC